MLREAHVRNLFSQVNPIRKFISLQVALQLHGNELMNNLSLKMVMEYFVPRRGLNPAQKEVKDSEKELIMGCDPIQQECKHAPLRF